MNATDTITFGCPSCSTRLTVPSQLAGITGPCPYCQVLIQAPYPVQQAPAQYEPVPQQQPYYQQPQQYAPQAAPPQPQPQPVEPTVVRPEPRQLPNRSEPLETPTRMRSDPSGDFRPRLGDAEPPPRRHHRSRLFRLLVPMLFIGLAVGVIYGVKTFLQMDKQTAKAGTEASSSADGGGKVRTILPEDTGSSFEELVGENSGESLPVGATPMPDIAGSQDDPPLGASTVDGGIAALELLEKFLAMKTLEERLPHLETSLKEPALASTVLNAPLPEVLKITVDVRETNSIEQMVDYYYYVDFAGENGGANPQTMLVRSRGTSPPKVVVDPFLDLFGGRFERFAAKPTTEAGTFQIIINAGAFCYDDIPDADKKFTLKILPREDAREIAKAYFGKTSNIGYMLEDETSGIAYGQAKPCTILIRWNMEDDPKRPFLEALDIKALNWNP